jgi:hypothetical protein
VKPTPPPHEPPWGRALPPPPRGLCPDCKHVRKIVSAKGSVFWMCARSKDDERFPRYPAQPRMECPGFER